MRRVLDRRRLGRRIALIAQRLGGKRRLAARLGVSEAQLYRYIRGESVPRADFMVALAIESGQPLEWLFALDEPEVLERSGYGDTVAVPLYLDGRWEDSPPLVSCSRRWLGEIGVVPDQAVMVEVTTELEHPRLRQGVWTVAQRLDGDPVAAGWFALGIGEHVRVVRILWEGRWRWLDGREARDLPRGRRLLAEVRGVWSPLDEL